MHRNGKANQYQDNQNYYSIDTYTSTLPFSFSSLRFSSFFLPPALPLLWLPPLYPLRLFSTYPYTPPPTPPPNLEQSMVPLTIFQPASSLSSLTLCCGVTNTSAWLSRSMSTRGWWMRVGRKRVSTSHSLGPLSPHRCVMERWRRSESWDVILYSVLCTLQVDTCRHILCESLLHKSLAVLLFTIWITHSCVVSRVQTNSWNTQKFIH